MYIKRVLYFLIGVFNFSIVCSQNKIEMSYPFLESRIANLKEKPDQQFIYIKTMISKAKKENNIKKLHRAYSIASTYTTGGKQLKYSDSLLSTAYKQNNTDIIGDCYLSRGSVYMYQEKYQQALQDYLKGYAYIKRKSNPYLLHNAEYLIAQTKIYLGEYQEAHDILSNALIFYRKNHLKINDTDYGLYYIYTLISIIDTNSYLLQFQENKNLIKEGVDFVTKNNYSDYLAYFISAEGIDAFRQKDYEAAIKKLEKSLSLYHDNWKHLTDNYYLGISYWHIGDKNTAIPYLLLIDSEYKTTGKLDPMFHPALEILFDYYKAKGNKEKQLEYVQKLFVLSKAYERDYKQLYGRLQKDYNSTKWQTEKHILENDLIKEKRIKILMTGVSITFFSVLGLYTYRSHKRKKYYKNLLSKYHKNENNEEEHYQKTINPDSENISINPELSDINPLIIENILLFLEKFEKEKKYLEKELNIQQLAQQCGTNISYFSKVVNQYKNDNFLSYINNLRLEYVVQQWKTNPKTQHLMIQETALRAGFNTAQSFSKNFKEKYNISPSYFLKRLNMEKKQKST